MLARTGHAGAGAHSAGRTCRLVHIFPGDYGIYSKAAFFHKRIRTIQKISKISGSMVRIKYKLVLNKAGDRCFPIPTSESGTIHRATFPVSYSVAPGFAPVCGDSPRPSRGEPGIFLCSGGPWHAGASLLGAVQGWGS